MPKTWWPAQIAFIFWLIAAVVIAWAAKAQPTIDMAKSHQVEDCGKYEPACLVKRIDELEKRVEDLEINLAVQIAKPPCSCTTSVQDSATGDYYKTCLAKQGRFNMTKSEVESRLYSMWECAYNQGIRKHNDP